jgi:hypothetical protein
MVADSYLVLVNYSPQLEDFTGTLLKRIRYNLGKAITINEITLHYSYDVMTQLAFGESGGFVDENIQRYCE